MIGKVRFYSGKVRSKVRQRAVLSPCQFGSSAGIHILCARKPRRIGGLCPSEVDVQAF